MRNRENAAPKSIQFACKRSLRNKRRSQFVATVSAMTAFAGAWAQQNAEATPYTWVATSGVWTTPANWNPNGYPNATTDAATFQGSASATPGYAVSLGSTSTSAITINSLTFGANTGGDYGYVIGTSAQTLTMDGTSPTITAVAASQRGSNVAAILAGTQPLTITNLGAGYQGSLQFSNNNSYSGPITFASGGTAIEPSASVTGVPESTYLTGTGSVFANASAINVSQFGELTLGISAINGNNRLGSSSTPAVTLLNGGINGNGYAFTSAAPGTTNDLVSTLNVDGLGVIGAIAGTYGTYNMNITTLKRVDGGVALISGTNLGNGTANATPHILLGTAPTLVGTTPATTGEASGVYNTQIVPYMVGEVTATTGGVGTAGGTYNTFLTYNATTGLRPLNLTDEFVANSFATPAANVYLTSTSSSLPTGTTTINSLIFGNTYIGTVGANAVLNLTSGALLFATGTNTRGFGIASTTLNFGGAEGIITALQTDTNTIASHMTGSAGFTKAGGGTLTLTDSDAYTGATSVGAGTLAVTYTAAAPGSLTATSSVNLSPVANLTLTDVLASPNLINDSADVTLKTGSTVALALSGNQETIGEFDINGVDQGPGVFGSQAYFNGLGVTPMGAPMADESFFSGNGAFNVTDTVPEPTSMAIIGVSAANLLSRRRRQSLLKA